MPHEQTAFHLWQQFDAELAKTFSKFFVGGLYQREVITQRERELCAVAALTVMRARDELRLHVHAARNKGATAKEIAEVIFQMVTYGGAPATVQGFRCCAMRSRSAASGLTRNRKSGSDPVPTPIFTTRRARLPPGSHPQPSPTRSHQTGLAPLPSHRCRSR